jgi:putative ABC transport system permease protein
MPEWRREIRERLAALGLDAAREAEIVEELSQHLDDRYAELRGRGLDDRAARIAALEELNDGERLDQQLRAVTSRAATTPPLGGSPGSFLQSIWQDAWYSLRTFRTRPTYAVVVALTFALAIGASTLIFGAVHAVIQRPLPFPNSDRLVVFWGTAPEKGLPEVSQPTGMFVEFRDKTRTLTSLAAFSGGYGRTLTGKGDPVRLVGAGVSREFFGVLGVPPLLGRTFAAGDDAPNAPPTVVIGYSLWKRFFNGDSGIVGRAIDLGSRPTTVIGVMPAGFDFPGRAELWSPENMDARNFNCWCWDMLGRMKAGVTPAEVAREIASISDDFGMRRHDVFPDAKRGGSRYVAMTLGERIAGDLQRPLLVLFAAVGLVLLIACANIANLAFVRATSRHQEIAVRCCLGAGPRRIAAQLLTESVLLALLGSIGGLVVAFFGMRVLRQLPPDQFPRLAEMRLDPTVLAFTAGVAAITGLICGAVPAFRVRALDLSDAIKTGVRGLRSTHSRRWSDAFVVIQFALSLVLLVGAGLLLKSYRELSHVDPGYRTENLLLARIALPYPKYDTSTTVRAFYDPLLDRVRGIPGVSHAALASTVPLTPGNPQNNVVAEGHEPKPGEPVRVANVRIVTSGYFEAMGTPMLEGRDFRTTDDEHAPRVAIVDEAFAKHFWPHQSALGKRFSYGGGDTSAARWMTVIAVVRNIKHNRLDEDTDLQAYEPFSRAATWSNYLVIRSSAEPDAILPRVRAEMKSLDPALPLFDVHTMGQAVSASLGIRRLTNALLGGFALAALLLAAMGIYGVISIGVSARVREFGIRMALGAQTADVRALVLRHGVALAAIGVALGFASALYLTRFLQRLLFGVAPLDWPTFAAVAVVLTITALLASYVPARRATRADPVLALKTE